MVVSAGAQVEGLIPVSVSLTNQGYDDASGSVSVSVSVSEREKIQCQREFEWKAQSFNCRPFGLSSHSHFLILPAHTHTRTRTHTRNYHQNYHWNYHNNYQDIEAFLRAGGRRGKQYAPLLDGTYFINRWFATVEMIPKTVVPIGFESKVFA